MKVSPLAQGTGVPAASDTTEGRSASQDRLSRAKQVAEGKTPQERTKINDAQVDRAEQSIKKIKMRTQRSVYRELPQEDEQLLDPATLSPEQSNISDTVEQAASVTEEIKPIGPQFAAIAKAKRALQVKEREIQAREEALKSNPGTTPGGISIESVKANPLSVLREAGVTNDQLTEAILAEADSHHPKFDKYDAELNALREEIKNQNKSLSERDEHQKRQVLAQMERDAAQIVAQGDEYEMVREKKAIKSVIKLIDREYTENGNVLDVDEALGLVENALLEEALEYARIKKVQSKLTPAQPQQPQPQNTNSNVRVMRTLTNRDGASVPSSSRERAIAAFWGKQRG
jgi:hypothetical protein